MLKRKTRQQLFDDKMYFSKESIIPVNALELIDELNRQEFLERENAQLKDRIETLEALLAYHKSAKLNLLTVYDLHR